MRHTRAHTKNRRSHHALKTPTMVACKHCDAHHRPHHMCLECGFYNGRQVIDLTAKKEAREARMKAKRERIKAQADELSGMDAAPEQVAAEAPEENKTEEKTDQK
ncbi:MAG: 50S ribosomal protein L32 [Bacteroidota bacterium]